MAFVRSYVMTAKGAEIADLRAALLELGAKVTALDGCTGTELYQDADRPERFVFLERWSSVDAQKAGGKRLGKEAFAAIMRTLAGPPEAASLDAVG